MNHSSTSDPENVLVATRNWVDSVVIGLNLCPFARTPQLNHLIKYVLSEARDHATLLQDLENELQFLTSTPPSDTETTILVHPYVLNDFYDYNLFLDEADALLKRMQLDGVIQIASMHPDYQFADTKVDDVENYTNRSPYPLLHLIREQSIDNALDSYQNPERIPERNIRIMKKYGIEHMKKLLSECYKMPEEK